MDPCPEPWCEHGRQTVSLLLLGQCTETMQHAECYQQMELDLNVIPGPHRHCSDSAEETVPEQIKDLHRTQPQSALSTFAHHLKICQIDPVASGTICK